MPPKGTINKHGTQYAYERHLKLGIPACKECLAANSEHTRKVKEKSKKASASVYMEALETEPDVTENLDRLAELRDQLKQVRAAMATSSQMHIAGLSKERREIAKEIKELEAAQNETKEVDALEALLQM